MWEHIRRFMEDNGHHLPRPDEPLANAPLPKTWWQSLGALGVFGPGYIKRWRERPVVMFPLHRISPLLLPVQLIWATGNWLSHKTEIQVDWPDEVKQAIGPVQLKHLV